MNITAAVATSRLAAQQRAIEVIANNLANATTTGYRAMHVQFADWLSPQRGGAMPPGGQTVAYAQDRATWRDERPGPLIQTGNPFDLALAGEGFFRLQAPSGQRLSRAGRFSLSVDGTLSTEAGEAVLDANGRPIQIPASEPQVTIAPDGTIRGRNATLGKIAVVRPENPTQLQPVGNSQFSTDRPTSPVSRPKMLQGMLEGANVEPVLETTHMVRELREFQFVGQFIQAEADRQQSAVDRILHPRQN